MVTAIAIVTLLGTVLTFIFAQITRRQERADREIATMGKVEVDELDRSLDELAKSRGLQPPFGG